MYMRTVTLYWQGRVIERFQSVSPKEIFDRIRLSNAHAMIESETGEVLVFHAHKDGIVNRDGCVEVYYDFWSTELWPYNP